MLAAAASVERQRLLDWTLAFAGLSAAWHLADGTPADLDLAVAALAPIDKSPQQQTEETMRGVTFPGERSVEIMNFPDPTPGPGEVVLEMKASGMCGSDLHQYRRPKNMPRTGRASRRAPIRSLPGTSRAASSSRSGPASGLRKPRSATA